jgi:thiosulfate reductase cytochrome b subunit
MAAVFPCANVGRIYPIIAHFATDVELFMRTYIAMAESAYAPGLAIRSSDTLGSPRHSAVVRITHWITTLSFFGLLVSGIAILLAHPRLYWGETGNVGTPSLIDLPLPFMLGGQSGWGRYLHFLSAWVCVLNGLFYALSGLITQHFRKNFLPAKVDLAWNSISRAVSRHLRFDRPGEEESLTYNVLQRLTYSVVVFVLFPLIIWTGLAMSPAIVSVFPALVTVLGGQQSARTIHFFVANFLVLFLLVHVGMVCLAGFGSRVRAMFTGHSAAGREHT